MDFTWCIRGPFILNFYSPALYVNLITLKKTVINLTSHQKANMQKTLILFKRLFTSYCICCNQNVVSIVIKVVLKGFFLILLQNMWYLYNISSCKAVDELIKIFSWFVMGFILLFIAFFLLLKLNIKVWKFFV